MIGAEGSAEVRVSLDVVRELAKMSENGAIRRWLRCSMGCPGWLVLRRRSMCRSRFTSWRWRWGGCWRRRAVPRGAAFHPRKSGGDGA